MELLPHLVIDRGRETRVHRFLQKGLSRSIIDTHALDGKPFRSVLEPLSKRQMFVTESRIFTKIYISLAVVN